MDERKRITVFYDGACHFCTSIMDTLERSKKGSRFDLRDMHSPDSRMPFETKAVEKEIHVTDGTTVYKGADAIVRIMEEYPRLRILTFLAKLPFVKPLLPFGYRLVARHRRTLPSFRAVALSILPLVVLIAGAALYFSQAPEVAAENWETRIDAVGAAKTYDEYKKAYKDKPFAEQHVAAHRMGALLYRKVGFDGFSVCDPSFAFGCYHAFFGQVLAERGVESVVSLARACRERYGEENSSGCEHGIGHGLMEHLGRGKLLRALELCETTGQREPFFGCTSGAFMEYNTATIFNDGVARIDTRAMDPDNPHEPCNTVVPEKQRPSCYYEISLWWKAVLGLDFEKVGNMCADAPGELERDACYRGWGTVVAENIDYRPDRALEACGLIRDREGALRCLAGVASRLFNGGHPREARELCRYIPPESIVKWQLTCYSNKE